jgi:hypothetical protein
MLLEAGLGSAGPAGGSRPRPAHLLHRRLAGRRARQEARGRDSRPVRPATATGPCPASAERGAHVRSAGVRFHVARIARTRRKTRCAARARAASEAPTGASAGPKVRGCGSAASVCARSPGHARCCKFAPLPLLGQIQKLDELPQR